MQELSKDIIQQAANGDIKAFQMIYQAYFSLVSNVARRVVNRVEDAEDVTQDVFINIYHNLKNFRFDASLKTWIYRITVNSAITYAKRTSKYTPIPEYMELSDNEYSKNLNETKIDNEVKEKVVANLLEQLNPEQRACIVLRSIEGLSYQEIAESLKIPINTVRSRIKRARETLLMLRREVIPNEM